MLKLKKIQILGFKSFCDRTEVQLAGEGIVAIVGPNGCGKSNIADAITWVLGEQSAKSLRGVKMEDVIFAGTRERRPTGMAEVSLTLVDPEVYPADGTDHDGTGGADIDHDEADRGGPAPEAKLPGDWDEAELRRQNEADTEEAVAEAQPGVPLEGGALSTGQLPRENAATSPENEGSHVVLRIRRRKFGRTPIRAGEITVTRRLFRSGDSEYLLNGRICRLRDIQDIFMGTGLGGESYAIIGQERIGQLLSAKPQDRRAIIEEAAGITRFKTKKRLAELRLEAARQNLSRVNDIFEEVTRQLGSLKRQAAKAERYVQVRDEMRQKLRVVLASRMEQLDHEHAAATEKIAAVSQSLDERVLQAEALDAEHTETVRQGYALDQQIREHAETANHSAVELERVTARAIANQDRIAELSERLGSGGADLEAAREQLTSLAGEQEQQRGFLETASAESQASQDEANLRRQLAQDAARAVQQGELQMETQRRGMLQLVQRSSQAHNEQAQAQAALAALELESERLIAESATAREELANLGQQRGQVSLSFESVSERLKRLELAMAELRLSIEAGRTEEASSKRKGDGLRGEIAGLNGRRTSLEGLIRDHSYSTDTVKNIFRAGAKHTRDTGRQSSTLGTLADFLEVDGAYEQVVDDFLREELNYIVVKNWEAADDGIRLLKTEVAGRATFLVEASSATDAAPPRRSEVPSGADVRPLTECIRVLNGFGRSLEVLLPKLREGFIVPDSIQARTLAADYPQAYFLAPSGEAFHHVTVTGGRPSSGGPLALKRELREVEAKLRQLEQELGEADLKTAELQRDLARQAAEMDASSQQRREAERESANSGAALRQMESESARIERRLQEWMLATDRNRDARTQKADLIADRQQRAEALDQERLTLDTGIATLATEVEVLRVRRDELQHAATAAAAALAGLEERRRNAQAALGQTTRILEAQQQRISQLAAQLETAAGERQRREQETAVLAERQGQLADAKTAAGAEVTRLTEDVRTVRSAAAGLDATLRALRIEIEGAREQRSGLSARVARLSSDTEHLEAACLNDLAAGPSELRADRTIARIGGEELNDQESETRTLKQKLEAMGPVNMMALEEYQETSERHAFLEAQRRDLLESIDNTVASVKEIDDVSRVKFDEAYTIINENFGTTFAKLFGGGHAFMRLTDEENRAEAGIEIVASPPGKKLQNILLLSGGEKALTALSLLVGIFQFQPAPFCILDEVDAPLDETNVGRYASMISEMSVNTQFIAITHSRRTMQQADVIYGVTMQEPGISKIVSVNLGQGNRTRSRAA